MLVNRLVPLLPSAQMDQLTLLALLALMYQMPFQVSLILVDQLALPHPLVLVH